LRCDGQQIPEEKPMTSTWIPEQRVHDDPLHGELDFVVGLVRACRLDEARRVADEVLARTGIDDALAGRAHSFRGEIASITGDLEGTIAEYEAAVERLQTTPLIGSLARAHRGRAEGFLNLGMVSTASQESRLASELVDAIGDARVRRRAALESAICDGLIQAELGCGLLSRQRWRDSAPLLEAVGDPLLSGLHDVVGGLALAAHGEETARWRRLLERAVVRFRDQQLPYYEARALELLARALAGVSNSGASGFMNEAAQLYESAGARLRAERARQWLEGAAPCTAAQCGREREVEGIWIAGPTTRAVTTLAASAAQSSSTVLITGESGTGKELIARLIHRRSRRREGPWIPFNCAAAPAEMVESVLFGYRRGAFTGATAPSDGLVRAADGGTLFLDEIGEIPSSLQAKLLRFLQEGEVLPLGETRPITVDVRIVAATNRDLERETRDGRFRTDLFHRLNVIRLQLVPLRERRDEILALAERLAAQIAARLQMPEPRLTAGAISPLLRYHWPGNVRELSNVLERVLVLHGSTITLDALVRALPVGAAGNGPAGLDAPASLDEISPLPIVMDAFERAYITRALGQCGGNRTRASALLGVSLQRLRYRMLRLGMHWKLDSGAGS
jgi:two-component system response regulator FlrC